MEKEEEDESGGCEKRRDEIGAGDRAGASMAQHWQVPIIWALSVGVAQGFQEISIVSRYHQQC